MKKLRFYSCSIGCELVLERHPQNPLCQVKNKILIDIQ